jgi:enoyl-CoA hydratase/carnithine racemase
MSDELVLIEKRDRIATTTLNRPPMNPMSTRCEQEICREVFAHPDAAEGPRAFTEKRGPRFTDL